MLREYDRIVDAYHNLHDQKNELLKFYLAFTTLPFAIVAISSTFIGLAGVEKQTVLKSLQVASVFLSVLLEMVGISVLMTMLKIRWEQYLYVKTINAARSYFHEVYGIPDKYLVLPHKSGEITFGQNDVRQSFLGGHDCGLDKLNVARTDSLVVDRSLRLASRMRVVSCFSRALPVPLRACDGHPYPDQEGFTKFRSTRRW
jgi:hypothetical protein